MNEIIFLATIFAFFYTGEGNETIWHFLIGYWVCYGAIAAIRGLREVNAEANRMTKERHEREDAQKKWDSTMADLNERIRRIREETEHMARTQQTSWCSILGVEKTATLAEVKAAYRKKVRLYHPDTAPDKKGNPRQLEIVMEAYHHAERQLG